MQKIWKTSIILLFIMMQSKNMYFNYTYIYIPIHIYDVYIYIDMWICKMYRLYLVNADIKSKYASVVFWLPIYGMNNVIFGLIIKFRIQYADYHSLLYLIIWIVLILWWISSISTKIIHFYRINIFNMHSRVIMQLLDWYEWYSICLKMFYIQTWKNKEN